MNSGPPKLLDTALILHQDGIGNVAIERTGSITVYIPRLYKDIGARQLYLAVIDRLN